MPLFFAVCTPGLEPFLAGELRDLGLPANHPYSHSADFSRPEESPDELGGVESRGSYTDLYRANLYLRTASRILMPAASFYADTFSDLKRRARRVPWREYLRPGQTVSLRVSCRRSRLFHSGAVAERILEAIAGAVGAVPPVRKFEPEQETGLPQLIIVRLVENQCTIHLDSSGELLHRRGYRLAAGKAPLRETLAAALLLASRWDTRSPLLDPFCGSGTIAIEAALLARRMPPGARRRFAFMNWSGFDSAAWAKLLTEIPEPPKRLPKIFASDRDRGVIESAQENADRAGIKNDVEFTARPISAIDPPPGPGWVVTNPPYGVRLSLSPDLVRLYTRFGRTVRTKCRGWKIAMLGTDARLLRATGIKFDSETVTRNGGLKVKMMRGVTG